MIVFPIVRVANSYHPTNDGRMIGATWTECSACAVWLMVDDVKCRGCGGEIDGRGVAGAGEYGIRE